MSGLILPGKSEQKAYIQAVEVQFKSKPEKFVGYRWYQDEEQHEAPSFKGIPVGQAFMILTDQLVSKEKSVTYMSEPFGWDVRIGKPGARKIKITKRVRENGQTKYLPIGEFTFAELCPPKAATADQKVKNMELCNSWGIQKVRAYTAVYMLDDKANELYRVMFSPASGRTVGKLVTKESPNYVCTFGVSAKPDVETVNGMFHSPTFSIGNAISPDVVSKVSEKIKFIDDVVNGREALSMPASQPTEEKGKDLDPNDIF